MNASTFMDKQIMDLSRSKSDLTNNNTDFIDLMNPQSEEEETDTTNTNSINNKKDEILPNYDFHPILRPAVNAATATSTGPTFGSKPNSSPLRSYNSVDHVEPDKIILEKAEKVNDSAILFEIDRTMKRYTDNLMHAIDTVSARMSQLENKTRHLEHSVEDLKASVGNNYGSTDGKLRQLENILLEVQSGVHNLKDKQELLEGHMQLAKLQNLKVEQSSELPNATHLDSMQQQTAASAPPQQSGHQQFPIAGPQPVLFMPPPNAPVPSSQQSIHPPPPVAPQSSYAPTPALPQRDAYFSPQTQEVPRQQYQIPPPQHQQQLPIPAPQPQQYQPAPTPPYPQPPQPPQQQHPSVVGGNPPQFQPPLGLRSEENTYAPPQTYLPNLHQPTSQPSSAPPHSQSYYGSPSPMYEPPPSARSSSGFLSAYVPPSGPSEPYSYGGPASHYDSGSSVKPQPHSPRSGNYPQLPTARLLPQAIPTAAGVSGGSSSGGSGNKVPIDDVVDKVTNMGFPREQVKATVRRLTENGQSVDLNIVLDKLMNDVDVQPPKGWFGR